MRPRDKPGTSRRVATPVEEEPEEEYNLKRFLKLRKKRNVDSSYHPSHDKHAVAVLPNMEESLDREVYDEQEDPDVLLMHIPVQAINYEDISTLKEATTHLPDDIVLQLLSFCEFNVGEAIEQAQLMKSPSMVPEGVKKLIVANIAMERDNYPTKKKPYKEFYFARMLAKTVPSDSLVNFYYSEKNKHGNNMRLEQKDKVETPEDKADIDERMKKAGMSFDLSEIPRIPPPPRKPVVTRRSIRRTEAELLQSNDRAPSEAPTTSSASSSSPSTNGVTETNGTASANHSFTQPSGINLRFRIMPGSVGNGYIVSSSHQEPSTSSSSGPASRTRSVETSPSKETPPARNTRSLGGRSSIEETETPPKKKPRRTSEQQKNGGAQKTYPKRERRNTGPTE